jgi:predicted Co/Zn/Cd cation transporter (cation efflux family)
LTLTAQQDELRVLRFSSILTFLFALGAVAVALLSDSETMSLQAMSGVADVLVSLLAIFVVRKIHEPANSRYHFGYAKYEPLMVGLEGTLVAAVCLTAIASAVTPLYPGCAVTSLPFHFGSSRSFQVRGASAAGTIFEL